MKMFTRHFVDPLLVHKDGFSIFNEKLFYILVSERLGCLHNFRFTALNDFQRIHLRVAHLTTLHCVCCSCSAAVLIYRIDFAQCRCTRDAGYYPDGGSDERFSFATPTIIRRFAEVGPSNKCGLCFASRRTPTSKAEARFATACSIPLGGVLSRDALWAYPAR